MPYQWQLIAGIVFFYLLDSVLMLYANEVVFTATRHTWRFSAAGSRWLLLGRSVYLANPLMPHKPVFRLFWSTNTFVSTAAEGCADLPQTVTVEQRLACALWFVVLIAVPLSLLFFSLADLLGAIAITYALVMAQLVQIWRHRNKYALGVRQFWLLAADGLLCVPFSINTYRKLTMQFHARQDALSLAHSVLEQPQLNDFIHTLIGKVDAELQLHEDEGAKVKELVNYKNKLADLLT